MKRTGLIKEAVLFLAVSGMLTAVSCDNMSDKNDSDRMDEDTELNKGNDGHDMNNNMDDDMDNDMYRRDTMNRMDTMNRRDTGMRGSSTPRNH